MTDCRNSVKSAWLDIQTEHSFVAPLKQIFLCPGSVPAFLVMMIYVELSNMSDTYFMKAGPRCDNLGEGTGQHLIENLQILSAPGYQTGT